MAVPKRCAQTLCASIFTWCGMCVRSSLYPNPSVVSALLPVIIRLALETIQLTRRTTYPIKCHALRGPLKVVSQTQPRISTQPLTSRFVSQKGPRFVPSGQVESRLAQAKEDKRMASRLIRNQLPSRVAGSTPVSSAFDASPFND